jgi:hypothetical protein
MVFSGAPLLESIIRPDVGGLSQELARYILDFTPAQHARYAALAGQAETGALTESEAAEIDEYLAANAILTLLQAKARHSLKQHQPAA